MTPERLDEILAKIRALKIAIVGEVFLDKYFDIDRRLAEVSLETGKEAHQVVDIRTYPGSGGSVGQKLVALGVSWVPCISVIGQDGEGHDLKRAAQRDGMDPRWMFESPDRRTGTYMKPFMREPGKTPYELERLDVKNYKPLPAALEQKVIDTLAAQVGQFDAVIVIDQVPERNCGVITDRVRDWTAEVASQWPGKVWFADSRCRIGEFRNVTVKPNQKELAEAVGLPPEPLDDLSAMIAAARELTARTNRPAIVTRGPKGVLVMEKGSGTLIPGYAVAGPIDIVGAGDSVTAGTVTALCAGATLAEAALIGTLVASITIQQLGVTGTATPEQLRARLFEYNERHGLKA